MCAVVEKVGGLFMFMLSLPQCRVVTAGSCSSRDCVFQSSICGYRVVHTNKIWVERMHVTLCIIIPSFPFKAFQTDLSQLQGGRNLSPWINTRRSYLPIRNNHSGLFASEIQNSHIIYRDTKILRVTEASITLTRTQTHKPTRNEKIECECKQIAS